MKIFCSIIIVSLTLLFSIGAILINIFDKAKINDNQSDKFKIINFTDK